MRSPGELPEAADAASVFVRFVVFKVQRRRDDVVLFSGDEQERSMRLFEIDKTFGPRAASRYVSALGHDI